MINILQTSKVGRGAGSHFHLAVEVVNEATGQVTRYIAPAKGHTHAVEQEVIYNETEIGEPQGMAQWVIYPAGKTMHSHEFAGEYIPEPKDIKEEAEDLEIGKSLWKGAVVYNRDSKKLGKKAVAFVEGEHWDKKTLQDLNDKDRCALTLNYTEAITDSLCGYQRRNRTKLHCYAVDNGDQLSADIMNVCLNQVLESNEFSIVDSCVFEDKLDAGIGVFEIYVDYSENPEGEIVINHYPWDDVDGGPHNSIDQRDMQYAAKHKWYSLREAKDMFPEKASELERVMCDLTEEEEPKDHVQYHGNEAYEHGTQVNEPIGDLSLSDVARKTFKVVEVVQRYKKRVYWLSNYRDASTDRGDHVVLEDFSAEEIAAIKGVEAFVVTPFLKPVIKIITFTEDILLDAYFPDDKQYPFDGDINLVFDYAKKRKNKYRGKVQGLMDMNKQIDKMESLIVDYATKANANPTFVRKDMFSNPSDFEDFKDYGSSPGTVWEVNDMNDVPRQMEGQKIPPELFQFSFTAPQKVRDLANVNLAMLGQAERQSGKALLFQEEKGLVGNEYLYDNHSNAKKRLGKLIIKAIQKIYSKERVIRILYSENARNELKLSTAPLKAMSGQQAPQIPQTMELMLYPPEVIQSVLDNFDLVKFDLIVDENLDTPAKRQAALSMMERLGAAGLPPDPTIVAQLSDMPASIKAEYLQNIRQQQQAGAMGEQLKYFTEQYKSVAKELFRQGIISPQLAQQLGLQQGPAPQQPGTGMPPNA